MFSFSLRSHFPDQAEKFVDIFQKTALGKLISALTEEDKEMLFQCYITDFIVLSIGVSSVEELQVSVWNKSWEPSGWTGEQDGSDRVLLCPSGLFRQSPALGQTDSKAATKQMCLIMAAEVAETFLRKVLS